MNASAFREELRSHLKRNASRVLLRVLLSPDAVPVELTGEEILLRSGELASRHVEARESGVVLLLLPHSLELFLLHFGIILAGRVPAILAWPTNRINGDKYQRNLLHQLRHLPADQIITLPRLASNLAGRLPFPATPCPVESAPRFEKAFLTPLPLEVPDGERDRSASNIPEDGVFLQFSGGTTGSQKAVIVTADILIAQLERLRDALQFTDRDGVCSWLPMYHDMGLIACLWFPLWCGAPSVQFSASDWLLNPGLLFALLERYQATFCWLPNFAFSYLAAQEERIHSHSYSLTHVRGFINCSEPVRMRSFREFAEAFGSFGITMESLQASYAMAENVFAVTQTPLGAPPRTVSRQRLQRGTGALTQAAFDLVDDVYTSSGRPLPGMEVRIVDPAGRVCRDYEPGDIQLRTESLFSGYWTSSGLVTSTISGDGWYTTGDYGFQVDTDLYIIGRIKDIIIVGGQNIFPEDVEAVVNSLSQIYTGRVVAFGVDDEQYGTESLAVVAELRGEFSRPEAETLEKQIQSLVLSTVGIAPRYAAVVPERWIVKSTAGKISRRDTRERFRLERFGQVSTTRD